MVVDDPESKDKINALLGDEGKPFLISRNILSRLFDIFPFPFEIGRVRPIEVQNFFKSREITPTEIRLYFAVFRFR